FAGIGTVSIQGLPARMRGDANAGSGSTAWTEAGRMSGSCRAQGDGVRRKCRERKVRKMSSKQQPHSRVKKLLSNLTAVALLTGAAIVGVGAGGAGVASATLAGS